MAKSTVSDKQTRYERGDGRLEVPPASSGGSGTVTSVSATDTSIVVGGTNAAPTIATGTLDVVATQHPPAASVPMNSQKLTGLANGSSATDSAAFGQLPSSGTPLALASGGTGVSAASDSALLTDLGALASANNLSDVASTATAVANLGAAAQGAAAGGLGTAALGQAIMSLPVALINVNVNSVAEFLYMILCTAEFTKTINTLGCYIQIAGITTGTGVNGLAIYSEAGSKLGVTGDMTTQFETLGNAEGTLGSGVAITAGTNYYLCFLHNFTGTVPKPVGYTALTLTTGDPLVGSHYPALTYGSQASFPTSVTPSSGTGTANHFWIYGR